MQHLVRTTAVTVILLFIPLPALAQSSADGAHSFTLEDRLSVQAPLPLFTAWAWVTVADSAGDHTYNWTPVKRRVKDRLLERLPPAYLDTLRAAYEAIDPDGYHMTVMALHLTPPPDMRLDLEAARERARAQEAESTLQYLDAIEERAAELVPLLNEFYHRADIAGLRRQVSPTYRAAIGIYKAGTIAAVREALDYLRLPESSLSQMDRVVIVPCLIGMLGSAMAPTLGGVTYNVEFPTQPVDSIRFHAHEYIHFMVGDLTRGDEHREQIERITAHVWDDSAGANARKYYPDPVHHFDENLVRTLTGVVLYGGVDTEKNARSVEYQHGRGFLLVPSMADALRPFEQVEMTFADYFPTFLDRLETSIPQRVQSAGDDGH